MMVADDEIHAFRLRIDNLFRGFDAAVQVDDKPHALAGGEVDTFDRNTVSFGITVGDVEHQVFVPALAQELVNQRDGPRTPWPPTTGKPAPPTSAAWWTRSSAEPEPIETFCNTRERMISHEDR